MPLDTELQAPDVLATDPEEDGVAREDKKRWQEFRQFVDVCKVYRRKVARNWARSIDYRRGKPFTSQSDDDMIAVNVDWSQTKTKQAALFSQMPRVFINHPPESVEASSWVNAFERKVNGVLMDSGVEAVMEEVLPDCINAAGIGVALVSYQALTEERNVPKFDISILPPEMQASVMQTGTINGQPVPMETVPVTLDKKYTVERISPVDFLWPIEFTGSDFDKAPWVGRSGRITWAEAVQRFGVSEENKAQILGEDSTVEDRLSYDWDKEKVHSDGKVGFDEIFYWDHKYDADSKSFHTIKHLVFLHGMDKPVIDEPWKGQYVDEESGEVVGATKFPIRVLTLTYLTDETIPPSDSAIARPQVDELNKGRTLAMKQRERSLPLMWHNSDRMDPLVQQAIMRGVWQHSIPVQGDGNKVMGAIQRSPMSPENFTFDRIYKQDINETWGSGPNQVGSGTDIETKGEASVIQANFTTKMSKERARVTSFFVGIAQVMGGFVCLYEDPAEFGEGFDPSFSRALNYSVLADSTILLDSNQRIERLNNFVNMYGKSGFVKLEPILKEIASLVGLDAASVIEAPQPAPPDQPNISLRLTGEKDMMNPLMLAFLLKSGQAPEAELIDKAKELIQQAVIMAQPPQQPGPGGPPQDQALVQGPPQDQALMQGAGGPVPQPPPPQPGEANPQLSTLPQINKRSEPGGNQ